MEKEKLWSEGKDTSPNKVFHVEVPFSSINICETFCSAYDRPKKVQL